LDCVSVREASRSGDVFAVSTDFDMSILNSWTVLGDDFPDYFIILGGI